jgi:hypothetical protein
MNWFKIHLNWTLVISFPEEQLWKIIVSLVIMEVEFWSLILFVSAWVLKRKNRSLWWLCVLFIPPFWGYFGLMFLKNKKQIPSHTTSISFQEQV